MGSLHLGTVKISRVFSFELATTLVAEAMGGHRSEGRESRL